jgi:hypothetical protein
MWADDRAIRWPDLNGCATAADFFLGLDAGPPGIAGTAPVITCSHFLPRPELMFPDAAEVAAWGTGLRDPQPRFNFSRVAGTRKLDMRIRQLGACVHVYGHQHRNRRRTIDGVTYVSHCLGYPRERAEGRITGRADIPLPVWDTEVREERTPGRDAGNRPRPWAHTGR